MILWIMLRFPLEDQGLLLADEGDFTDRRAVWQPSAERVEIDRPLTVDSLYQVAGTQSGPGGFRGVCHGLHRYAGLVESYAESREFAASDFFQDGSHPTLVGGGSGGHVEVHADSWQGRCLGDGPLHYGGAVGSEHNVVLEHVLAVAKPYVRMQRVVDDDVVGHDAVISLAQLQSAAEQQVVVDAVMAGAVVQIDSDAPLKITAPPR